MPPWCLTVPSPYTNHSQALSYFFSMNPWVRQDTYDEGTCLAASLRKAVPKHQIPHIFNNAVMLLLCPQSGPVKCGLELQQDTHSRLWHGSVSDPQEASRKQTANLHMAPFQISELS